METGREDTGPVDIGRAGIALVAGIGQVDIVLVVGIGREDIGAAVDIAGTDREPELELCLP